MANEESIEELRTFLDNTLDNTEVEEFRELSIEISSTVREGVYNAYGEKTTVDKTFTVKEKDVYKYSSNSHVARTKLRDNIDFFDELTDEQEEEFRKGLEECDVSIKDKIDHKTRVLMDDDRDFDAATIKAKSPTGIYLRLIDIDGSRSCSGEKVEPLEEIRQKHVKEIVKMMEYQPELLQVTEDMLVRAQAAVETRKSFLRSVEEVSE